MATITEDYVSFETAKLLKEKGFNGSCNRVYEGPNLKYTNFPISPLMSLGELGGFHPRQLYVTNNELGDIVYTAPTQQMALAWLREREKIAYNILIIADGDLGKLHYFYEIQEIDNELLKVNGSLSMIEDKTYETYEEAVEAAIKYCLENLI